MRILSFFCRILTVLALTALPANAAAKQPAGALPQSLPLEAMVGQMIMVGFRGDGASPNVPEMRTVLEDIRAGRVGGVIFFDRDWQTKKRGRNVTSVAQVTKLCALLQAEAPIPLFIAVDQEGGRVQRLRPDHGFAATPTAWELGKQTPAETEKAAVTMGSALRRIGINVNFAPVADIAIHPESPAIGALGRAFSSEPAVAAEHAAAFMAGLTKTKIIGSYKHFPGHGSAVADSHHKLTDITATWREDELTLYKTLPPNGPFMVMTGHLMHTGFDARYPASLSEKITTGLLRNKLGWRGVVVTDDLEMEAINLFYPMEERIRLAINAGVDIILFGNNLQYHPEQGRRVHAAIMRLVASGAVSPARIAESWGRIRALKANLQ
ncbi:Glycosyl hydrolase, family 3 (fragment) [uncultured delta proteobacterium]|uniref:Glycosyl hydrolase, family 3 n=1 Tax=uncultured delta proteobacterium TaxID=34034 RepID=A0A212JE57_9DELT